MILSAHQPRFMPWLGYFAKMLQCDVFIAPDDVRFKKNEWQKTEPKSSAKDNFFSRSLPIYRRCNRKPDESGSYTKKVKNVTSIYGR
ncbi:MAG: WbqC family protein [bacterium]